jgi:hypothetical protein
MIRLAPKRQRRVNHLPPHRGDSRVTTPRVSNPDRRVQARRASWTSRASCTLFSSCRVANIADTWLLIVATLR